MNTKMKKKSALTTTHKLQWVIDIAAMNRSSKSCQLRVCRNCRLIFMNFSFSKSQHRDKSFQFSTAVKNENDDDKERVSKREGKMFWHIICNTVE